MKVMTMRAALGAALLLGVPGLLAAQAPERSRFSASLALLDTQPLGELRTGPGIGIAGSAAYALDAYHLFRLRADFRLASYGHESRQFCVGGSIGCWIELDVNTDYTMVFAGLGPELALPVGPLEVVLDATGGIGYFGVSSSLSGVDDNQRFGTTNHYHDTVFAWSSGGELRIPVSRVLAISVGTHYVHNGQASYVVEGGITENPDGSLDVQPLTTDANLVAITLGVAVRPGAGGGGGRIR